MAAVVCVLLPFSSVSHNEPTGSLLLEPLTAVAQSGVATPSSQLACSVFLVACPLVRPRPTIETRLIYPKPVSAFF